MKNIGTYSLLDTFPIHHYQWENGFQALLVDNPISPVAAYLTLYSVGSAQENERQRGLAHFFEHMMFRETQSLGDGDFDRIISEIGGVGLNAYTAYDTTVYHVNVPAEHLGRVVELEADRMVNLRLSPDLIERERGAVLGELKMYKDMPSEQMWETLMAKAFPGHPYGHPIIGYPDQVEAFQDEDFTRFYQAHYAPNRAMVIIAGGFDHDSTLKSLDQAYGKLSPGLPLPDGTGAEKPWRESQRLELFHDKISSENLTLVYQALGLTHPDTPALILLSSVLSAGQSSPLYQNIVLAGIGTHVSATLLETEMVMNEPGPLLIDVSLQQGVPAERAEAVLDDCLRGFAEKGIPETDLERARNQVRLYFYGGLRSNMSLARQIGSYTLACGDPLYSTRLLDAILAIDVSTLETVMRKHLLEKPRLTVIQRPGKKGGKG